MTTATPYLPRSDQPRSDQPRPDQPARRPVGGRYVLLAPVAAGAMGRVWRGVDLRDGAEVAVKVLDPRDPAAGEGSLLRFVAEQGVRVHHPHVVAPTGWAADGHRAALGMRPVRGGSAAELLAEHGPLPASWVAAVLDQLLRALDTVHAAGLVHRDVKPANLLLEPGRGRPHARLADFGVAAPVDGPRLTRAGGVVGTDGYLSPEQARGEPPDPRQDLYAAGAAAVELLTGRPPYAGGPPADGVGLSPLLARLLDPDPGARPASAAEALVALRRLRLPDARADDRADDRADEEGGWPVVPDRWAAPPDGSRPDRAAPDRALAVLTTVCLAEAATLASVLAAGVLTPALAW